MCLNRTLFFTCSMLSENISPVSCQDHVSNLYNRCNRSQVRSTTRAWPLQFFHFHGQAAASYTGWFKLHSHWATSDLPVFTTRPKSGSCLPFSPLEVVLSALQHEPFTLLETVQLKWLSLKSLFLLAFLSTNTKRKSPWRPSMTGHLTKWI